MSHTVPVLVRDLLFWSHYLETKQSQCGSISLAPHVTINEDILKRNLCSSRLRSDCWDNNLQGTVISPGISGWGGRRLKPGENGGGAFPGDSTWFWQRRDWNKDDDDDGSSMGGPPGPGQLGHAYPLPAVNSNSCHDPGRQTTGVCAWREQKTIQATLHVDNMGLRQVSGTEQDGQSWTSRGYESAINLWLILDVQGTQKRQ